MRHNGGFSTSPGRSHGVILGRVYVAVKSRGARPGFLWTFGPNTGHRWSAYGYASRLLRRRTAFCNGSGRVRKVGELRESRRPRTALRPRDALLSSFALPSHTGPSTGYVLHGSLLPAHPTSRLTTL